MTVKKKKINLNTNVLLEDRQDDTAKVFGMDIAVKGNKLSKEEQTLDELKRRITTLRRAARAAESGASSAKAANNRTDAKNLIELSDKLNAWANSIEAELKQEETNNLINKINNNNDNESDDEAGSKDKESDNKNKPSDNQGQENSDQSNQSQNAQSNGNQTQSNSNQNSNSSNSNSSNSDNKAQDQSDENSTDGQANSQTGGTSGTAQTNSGQHDNSSSDESGSDQSQQDDGQGGNSQQDQNNQDNSSNKENSNNKNNGQDNNQNNQQSTNGKNGNDDDKKNQQQNSNPKIDPIKNPFDKLPRSVKPLTNSEQKKVDAIKQNKTQTKEEKLESIKQVLSKLARGEADGALAGLQEILKQKQASSGNQTTESLLQEASMSTTLVNSILKEVERNINKTSSQVKEDSFDGIINDIYKAIQTIAPGGFIQSQSLEDRKDMLTQIDSDPENNVENDYIDLGKKQHTEIETGVVRPREGKAVNLPKMGAFEKALLKAAQLDAIEVDVQKQTWEKPNRHHTNDGILAKATYWDKEEEPDIPVYAVFMDCSSSFSGYDIDRELAIINKLEKYQEDGVLKLQKTYFSDHLFDNYKEARAEGGTTAGPAIYDWVRQNQPANLIIITDSDLDALMGNKSWPNQVQLESAPTLRLEGNVWFIWKETSSPKFMKKFAGKRGNNQYAM